MPIVLKYALVMRTPFIAANWKMYKTVVETRKFIEAFLPRLKEVSGVDVLIAPPFTSLFAAAELLKGSTVLLGAQDVFYEREGAFTGEVSSGMLIDCGCSHVIIGHSERRQYFHDDDQTVNRKLRAAVTAGLGVIFCVGETLDEREAGKTFEVISRQIDRGLEGVETKHLIVAYEPVWAIGTGKNATPDQAQEVHAFVRGALSRRGFAAEEVRILYGGSVKPGNAALLMEQADVDGALVGGASLDPVSFSDIVKFKKV